MKGKKFTAAEKHFIKKEEQYQKRIKALEELVITQENKNIANENLIGTLKEENAVLKVQNEKLMVLCKLSPEELELLIKKDKNVAEAAGCMLHLMHINGVY